MSQYVRLIRPICLLLEYLITIVYVYHLKLISYAQLKSLKLTSTRLPMLTLQDLLKGSKPLYWSRENQLVIKLQ